MPKPFRPDRRTTMPLTGSLRHAELRLCFRSLVSAHYSVHALGRSCTLRPTLSAVARAALIDYARKIDRMSPEELTREARSVLSASKAFNPEPDAFQRTVAALEACGEADPLPSLEGVLSGPSGPLNVAALEAKVSETLRAISPRKFKDGL